MLPSYRFTGPTVALGCVSSAPHTPVSVSSGAGVNDQQNYAAFVNPASSGSVAVILTTGQASSGAVTAFPVDGTPTTGITFVLPPLMQEPMIVAVPGYPFWVSGINNVAATSTIFVTPCAMQP